MHTKIPSVPENFRMSLYYPSDFPHITHRKESTTKLQQIWCNHASDMNFLIVEEICTFIQNVGKLIDGK